MQAAFANWMIDMIDIHARYARDQSVSLAKIAWLDLQILWCDVKIAFYS